jgi:hypothetical protein
VNQVFRLQVFQYIILDLIKAAIETQQGQKDVTGKRRMPRAAHAPGGLEKAEEPGPVSACRLILLIRNSASPGPYGRPMARVLEGSKGGWRFLMGEVPLYGGSSKNQKGLTSVQGYLVFKK